MSAVTLRQQRGPGGWSETAVYSAGKLLGVVIHPCAGAKWFAHLAKAFGPRGKPYLTRKAAIEAVSNDR